MKNPEDEFEALADFIVRINAELFLTLPVLEQWEQGRPQRDGKRILLAELVDVGVLIAEVGIAGISNG